MKNMSINSGEVNDMIAMFTRLLRKIRNLYRLRLIFIASSPLVTCTPNPVYEEVFVTVHFLEKATPASVRLLSMVINVDF